MDLIECCLLLVEDFMTCFRLQERQTSLILLLGVLLDDMSMLKSPKQNLTLSNFGELFNGIS